MRACLAVPILALTATATVAGCAPDYSPNTYASNAVQQANKVDRGVVIGVRAVAVSVDPTLGAATGAAAGGAVGAAAGGNSVTSALGGVGGALLGGLVGTGAQKAVATTTAWEYIVRKPNGDLVSVTQTDLKPLPLGQKVLVIAGNQARIVPDYTKDETGQPPPPAAAPQAEAPPAVPPPIEETPLPAPAIPASAASTPTTSSPATSSPATSSPASTAPASPAPAATAPAFAPSPASAP